MARKLHLGEIVAGRGGLAFHPAPASELVVPRGEEVEVVVTYRYDEPGPAQDHFEAVLVVEADGGEHETRREIPDRPFQSDSETGALTRRLVVYGPTEGRFELRAEMRERSWSARPHGAPQARVNESGAFRIRIS